MILQQVAHHQIHDLFRARLVCKAFARVGSSVWIRLSRKPGHTPRHAAFTFPSSFTLAEVAESFKPKAWGVLPELIRVIHLDLYSPVPSWENKSPNPLQKHAQRCLNLAGELAVESGQARFREILAALPHLAAFHIAPWLASQSLEAHRLRDQGHRNINETDTAYNDFLKYVLPAVGQVPLQTLSLVADTRSFKTMESSDILQAFDQGTSAARYSIKTMTLTLTHPGGRDFFVDADFDADFASKASTFLHCFENIESLTVDSLYSPVRGIHNIIHPGNFSSANRKWLQTVLNGKAGVGTMPSFSHVPKIARWKRLKTLTVRGFAFGTLDMLSFLERHRRTLANVKLAECATDNAEDAVPFADTLRNELKLCDSVMNMYLVNEGRWTIV